ncbi:MAG: hypothetical protein HOC20_05125 [Chloroflexi bacterium]|nr:hypothetical protein [Chloroflexota bacterium]
MTFLDHRLIRGDSLTGPFFEDLLTFPVSGEPIDDLFAQQINERLRKTLGEALAHVNDLEASVGKDVADLEQKHTAKKRLDEALSPFRMLAAVWSGCVMLGDRGSDLAYRNLVTTVADQENIDIHKSLQPALQQMSDLGGQNLAYDLVFPEVFRLEGSPERNAGFDSILGNPPWDRIEIDPKQFFGNFDFRVIEAPNDSIRKELIAKLEANVTIASRWSEICGMIDGEERIHDRLFSHQSIAVAGKKTLGRPDTYRLFVERWYQLAKDDCGYTGWIVPSSFHSNEGAAGVRKLYLDNTNLVCCYSFENLKRLFDIDSRQKFAVAVAKKSALGTSSLRAAFYLLNPEWLFAEDKEDRQLVIVRKDLHRLSGAHEAFVEARSNMDLSLIVAQSNSKATDWGDWLVELGISTAFGVELHRNPAFAHVLSESVDTAARFQICQEEGWHRLPLHAGKTISQYTDMFSSVPENFVSTREAFSTRHWKRSVQGYRLAFRMKAASTNERTMIAAMLTPGFVCEQTLAVETDPMKRPNMNALITLGFANSYPFDWQVRQRVTTSLSNYILAAIPIPNIQQTSTFIFHSTLRLTCNHEGYSFLWNEQLGNEWRELTPKHAWPVLDGDDARWQVRAQIDAVVADRYGLDRRQYEHILSTFSHRSYPQAPELCLAAYDQLHPLVA